MDNVQKGPNRTETDGKTTKGTEQDRNGLKDYKREQKNRNRKIDNLQKGPKRTKIENGQLTKKGPKGTEKDRKTKMDNLQKRRK